MARMYPRRFPRSGEDGRWAEEQTFEAFTTLDDSWLVFYSVAWQSRRGKREGDGEADFVLVHPRMGIFTVEVKGGSSIEIIEGTWYTTKLGQRHALDKSPFSQAVSSKMALRRYLEGRVDGFLNKTPMGHFVVFPSHLQLGDLGPDGPRQIICDRDDLSHVIPSVNRIAQHWNLGANFNKQQLAQICQALAPTVTVTRLLRDRVIDVSEDLARLTDNQVVAMKMLRRFRRQLITGSAGTGKTVLAIARARQLADDGFRTLLICYNRPLGNLLHEEFSSVSLVTAGSFHAICLEMAQRAQMVPEGPQGTEWWDDLLPSTLPDAALVLNRQVDAIVIDEAQDMNPEWWDYLMLLFPSSHEGILSVFADSNQDVYRKGWLPPFEAEPVVLEINCRNTIEIAHRVAGVMPGAARPIGTTGIEPTFKEVETDRQVEKAISASLRLFIEQGGLEPAQVVILSTRTAGLDLANQAIRDLGHSIFEGVVLDTVHRFKGLESDAVILLLHNEDSEELRRLAYVGMSRARSLLHVIGPGQSKSTINW